MVVVGSGATEALVGSKLSQGDRRGGLLQRPLTTDEQLLVARNAAMQLAVRIGDVCDVDQQ